MATVASQIDLSWNFQIPIFSMQVPDFESHQAGLLDMISRKKEELKAIKQSVSNTWHSPNDMYNWSEEQVPWIISTISNFATQCIYNLNPAHKESNIILKDCWATVGGFGSNTSPHNHFPATWSGAFYVSVNDCIVDEEKYGQMEFLNPISLSMAFDQPNGVLYRPKDGLMVLFPSLLEHMVHPNMTQNERALISFNINVVPKG